MDGFTISEINIRSEGFIVTIVEMGMDVHTQLEKDTAITKLKNNKAPEVIVFGQSYYI
jgi:glycine/serine hydroxymethyltransferase